MYKKILVPMDISDTDSTILEHVRLLAKHTGASLVLVHVSDGFAARLQNQLNLTDSEEVCKDRQYLNDTVSALKADGFDAHCHLLMGEPVEEILDLVNEEKCDLIAMATHGHDKIADWFLGSVADGLRHKTDVPILMIRSARNLKK